MAGLRVVGSAAGIAVLRKSQSQESWKCTKEGKSTHPGSSGSTGLEQGRLRRSVGMAFGELDWSIANFYSMASHKLTGSGCVSEYLSGICV